MDNDLERSVRLLEDALSTPTKGLFRSTKSSKKKEKVLDLSITLFPEEEKMLYGEDTLSTPTSGLFKPAKTSKKDEKFVDLSISLFPEEVEMLKRKKALYNTTQSLLEAEKSLTGSVIQAGTPWTTTTNNLFVEFADILQTCSGGTEILEVAADLARCCTDALTVIQKLKSTVTVSEVPEEVWLEHERNNWRLLYVLYQDRLNAQNVEQSECSKYTGTSEKNCISCLFKRDSLIRESQLVIDWLERNALERDDPILHHSDWTYGWEHTLHQLLAPEAIAIGSNIDIINNIHPDAPQSQEKSLHHLDVANERKLCQRIFMEIRCGNLEGAQELCCNTGHPWRAAMLEGWKLFHNPNIKEDYEQSEESEAARNSQMDYDQEYQDVEGNSNRDLWKSSAIDYCKTSNLNIYEKAAIASLCGYLPSLLPVCSTWEDYLWAYMRTIVDIRVESEIRDVIKKNYLPLPEEYWDQKLTLNEIFSTLESSKNASVAAEARDFNHIIQKHIILDEIPELINLLEEWAEDPNMSTQSLRFFAHLVIFLDDVGNPCNRRKCEKVIEAYINKLSKLNETRLVAFYVSKLGKQKQVFHYAKHLEKIFQNKERKIALAYGEDFDLDMFGVTKTIVESLINQPSAMESSDNLQRKLTAEDEIKISSLDWLIFYEEQRVEALYYTNILIFKFLTLGKLEAAHLAISKIPSDSIEKIVSEGEVNVEVNQIIKEHLSYKAYLDANEAFNEWFKQYKNKPTPPPKLPENAQFKEKVTHEHKVSQYNAEIERWKLTTSHAADRTKTLLYNVLLFPEGWLVGANDADYLRSICIPEVVLLLYSLLHESGLHEEAVRLADLIAAEKHGLYKVYSKDKLAEILEKICESSVALLNTKKDPWGCVATA